MSVKQSSRFLSLMLILTLVFGTFCGTAAFAASSTTVTIYHTNDIHGKVNSTYAEDGTLTQIGMDVLKNVKANTPNSLLIDAGDATQGVALATYSQGADIIKLMNTAGYDGMTLGNHEFDYGRDAALSNAKLASFPVVSANAMDNGQTLLKGVNSAKTKGSGDLYDENGGWFIKTVAGKKIGFFGISTTETAYKTNPNNLKGVTFADEITTAKAQVSALQAQKADAIIGIMHVGIDGASKPTSHEIAQQVAGIDAIIDGHSHSTESTKVGNTVIQQTGTGAANLGKMVLSFDSSGNLTITASNLTPAEVGKQFQADATVTTLYDRMAEALAPTLEQEVGFTDTSLYGGTYHGMNICRVGETNLGSLIADAMIYGGKELIAGQTQYENLPMVSLENGGGVRTTIPAGKITVGDVINVLPFGNSLSVKEVTPDKLYAALENGVKNEVKDGAFTSAEGSFPQVGGMRFTFDISKPVGSRVTEIVLLDSNGKDAQKLNRNDTITKLLLVSNDFEVAGGDGYTMLAGLPYVAEGSALDLVTADYIRQLTEQGGGSFTYALQKRIRMVNNGQIPANYETTIQVMDGSSPLGNATISVQVDGGKSVQAKTNSVGKILVKNLSSGGHNISVTYNGKYGDAFVSDAAQLTEGQANLAAVNSPAKQIKAVSDTNAPVSLPKNAAYTLKVTVPQGTTPHFSVGNGEVLGATIVRRSGNDYYYQIHAVGDPGEKTGVYCTFDGQAAQLLCYASVA